jgi:glycosyltransferase involved in cell wall biosynthesis
VHQVDLLNLRGGGVDTCIRDIVAYAPPNHELRVVGVRGPDSAAPLGRWSVVDVGQRQVEFMPVADFGKPGRRRVPETLTLFAGLARYRRRIRPATVQVHRVETAAMAKVLFPRSKIIQFLHGDGLDDLGRHSDSFWRFFPVAARMLQRWAVRAAAQVHVFSADGGRRFSKQRDDVRVWRTWYDPAIFYAPQEARSGDILWIGRLEPPKDPLLALRAVAALRSGGVPAHLTLVGSGGLLQDVHNEIARLDLTSAVTYIPHLPRREVGAAMRSHRILLMTSHYEGSPRVLIEGLACDIKVVATKEADSDGVIRARSPELCVASREPSAIAEVLKRELARKYHASPARNNDAEVEGFSAPVLVAAILDSGGRKSHAAPSGTS